MWYLLQQLWKDEAGPTAVEYAVLLALLLGMALAAIGTFGTVVADVTENNSQQLQQAFSDPQT